MTESVVLMNNYPLYYVDVSFYHALLLLMTLKLVASVWSAIRMVLKPKKMYVST